MKLTAVDDTNRLFQVSDIVPADLVTRLQNNDWEKESGNIFLWQPDSNYAQHARKELSIAQSPLLKELDANLRRCAQDIAQILDLDFSYYYTAYWLDPPGWKIPIHTDCYIPCSLQLYWMGEPNTGTTFLHTKSTSDVRHQFDFAANTGYLMLNMVEDGVQPLQWHGMFEPITQWRFTTYTRLGSYYPRYTR